MNNTLGGGLDNFWSLWVVVHRSYERSVFKNNTLGFTRLGGDEDSNWKGS